MKDTRTQQQHKMQL